MTAPTRCAALWIALLIFLIALVAGGLALRTHETNTPRPPEPLHGLGPRSGAYSYPSSATAGGKDYGYYRCPRTHLPNRSQYKRSTGRTGGYPPVIDTVIWPALAAAPGATN